jgi:hypothetical protein
VALRKRGKYWYRDPQADIRDEPARFGKANEYVPTKFPDARCKCGSHAFRLATDKDQGVAVRICTACRTEHAMGDGARYLDGARLALRVHVRQGALRNHRPRLPLRR